MALMAFFLSGSLAAACASHMCDHQITVFCYCPCAGFGVIKLFQFFVLFLCPRFRKLPGDSISATERVATVIFRSLFLTALSSKDLHQLLVSIALNLTAAEPYLLFPLIWPQSACFIQQCFRQGATRLISAYVLHPARSCILIIQPH